MARKPKTLPTPEGREIVLKSRQAKVTNLNLKPEAHGKELKSRVDVSVEFLVVNEDVRQILAYDGDVLAALWEKKGEPRFTELDGKIPLKFKAQGSGRIGPLRGEGAAFGVIVLKNCAVEVNFKHELVVSGQLRVDPTGHLEMLEACHIARTLKFSFNGAVLVNAPPDDDDKAAGNDGQNKLPL